MYSASCLKSSAVIDGNDKIAKQVASTCHVFEYIVTHRERLFNVSHVINADRSADGSIFRCNSRPSKPSLIKMKRSI